MKIWIDFEDNRMQFVRIWKSKPRRGLPRDADRTKAEIRAGKNEPLYAFFGWPECVQADGLGKTICLDNDLIITANPDAFVGEEYEDCGGPEKLVPGEWHEV